MTLGIVEEMYKYPYDHGVKQEATYHGQQFGGGNKVVNVKELLEHFVHDVRIYSIRDLFNQELGMSVGWGNPNGNLNNRVRRHRGG